MNQGPAGLQPDALPLSYIPVCGGTSKQLWSILTLRFVGDTSLSGRVAVAEKKNSVKSCLSEMGFEPMPSSRTRNLSCLLRIAEQGLCLESGALDHSAILTSYCQAKQLATHLGIEPRTFGLEVQRAILCANGSC